MQKIFLASVAFEKHFGSQVRLGYTLLTSVPTSQYWCLHVQRTDIQYYSKTVKIRLGFTLLTSARSNQDALSMLQSDLRASWLVRIDVKRVKPNRIYDRCTGSWHLRNFSPIEFSTIERGLQFYVDVPRSSSTRTHFADWEKCRWLCCKSTPPSFTYVIAVQPIFIENFLVQHGVF